jgi:hypothetical protein
MAIANGMSVPSVAAQYKLTEKLVTQWKRKSREILLFAHSWEDSHSGRDKGKWRKRLRRTIPGLLPAGKFPIQQLVLFEHFIYRREVLGLVTGGPKIKDMFRDILRHTATGWESLTFSEGWLTNWKRRFNVCGKVGTRKKPKPLREMLPRIAEFHRQLIYQLPRSIEVAAPHAKYGAFPPSHRWHMDQVPLPFVVQVRKRTLQRRRDEDGHYVPAWVRMPATSGLDKRQASLMPCIRPEGDQSVPLLLIFRGKGCSPSMGEIEAMQRARELGVVCMFQPKAWADSQIMLRWLVEVFAPSIRDAGVTGWVVLGMDRHGPQISHAFQSLCRAFGIIPVYTPEGTTDVTAPVDHHVGKHLKSIMQTCWEEELQVRYAIWSEEEAALPRGVKASYRRCLMLSWGVRAWADTQTRHHMLRQAFVSTGWLNSMDGSENHLVQVKGCDNYDLLKTIWE